MARANAVVETSAIERGGKVVGMAFEVKGQGRTELIYSNVPEMVREQAMIQGFKTRISNAAALSRDTKTGASATPAQKWEGVKKLAEHYNSGATSWNIERAGGGRGPSGDALRVVRAVANVQGIEFDKMVALVEKRVAATGSTLAKWAAGMSGASGELGDRIRAEVVRLLAQEPKPEVDADDELAAMMAEMEDEDDAQDNNGDNDPPF